MAVKIETYHDLSNHQLHNCCQKTSPTGEVFVPLMVSKTICARRRWTVKVQRNLMATDGHGWRPGGRHETPALLTVSITCLLTNLLTDSLIHSLHGCCVDAWQVSISILILLFPFRIGTTGIQSLSWASRLGTDTLRQPSTTWDRWSVTVAASGLAGTQARRDLHQNSCATWEGFREWLGGGSLRTSRMF